MTTAYGMTRRQGLQFLAGGALGLSANPLISNSFAAPQDISKQFEVVAASPDARIEKVGDGLYAVISTPLDEDGKLSHRLTLCNGGLIETDKGVIAFDAYLTPQGAEWVALQAREITGKPITHVIISHLHLDHSGGIAGFLQAAQPGEPLPEIVMTEITWQLIQQNYYRLRREDGNPFARPVGRLIAPTRVIQNEGQSIPLRVDGRDITIEPLAGHTPSDLALRIADQPVIFGGDLMWWGLFPNYRDAVPSALDASVKALTAKPGQLIVTGHGGLQLSDGFKPYVDILDSIRRAANAGMDAGVSPAEAATGYSLPPSAEGWIFFSDRYPEVAIASWYREAGITGQTGA